MIFKSIFSDDKVRSETSLSDITRGLYHAGATVNSMLSNQYVEILKNFFDYDEMTGLYVAKMIEIRLSEDRMIQVPMISLVVPKGLFLDKMHVSLSLSVNQMTQKNAASDENYDLTRASFDVNVGPRKEKHNRRKRDMVDIDIDFEAFEPPEGFMRLLDQFHQQVEPLDNSPDLLLAVIYVNEDHFMVKWKQEKIYTSYKIDVATDKAFKHCLKGYEGLNIGDLDQYVVDGLDINENYFCRIRGVIGNTLGEFSNKVFIRTYKVSEED